MMDLRAQPALQDLRVIPDLQVFQALLVQLAQLDLLDQSGL